MKKTLVIVLILSCTWMARGQEGAFSTSATVGITTPVLDNGLGFHIGVNPSYRISSHFSMEGQVSYLYTQVVRFLSGGDVSTNAINTLVGGRLYVNEEEKANRFYLSLLFGGNYNDEKADGFRREGTFIVGFSGGGFFEWNQFLIGLSYDTPQNIVLKGGYAF